MTAEQLEELLGKVTQGDWRVAGKSSGYIVSNSESVVIAVVGDYRDNELLPFNKDRWDADCALFALAPSLARRVIWAEKLVEAVVVAMNCMDSGLGGLAYDELETALTAYREASK